MISEYKKVIIMAVILLVLVIGLVVIFTTDINFGLFKNIGFASISAKKVSVDTLIQKESDEKIKYEEAIDSLQKSKNSYEVAKESFENIDESTIDLVKEATKDEKYFIEYLWIVLGNYATENNLIIDIITPGSTMESANKEQDKNGKNENNATSNTTVSTGVANNTIRIVVAGRYANVADFVYEVENDKELKFKLDNIKMSYLQNNSIQATFNVLSLQVKK